MALDLGTRRTGVAISDAGQRVAFARPELEHHSDKDLKEQLEALIHLEGGVGGILVGLPTKLSGEASLQTEKVRVSLAVLAALGLPIEEMDERWTSRFAEDLQGFRTDELHHDSRAAQILLENHLDSLTQAL